MIDIDVTLYVEYDDRTKDPLALCELARDVEQEHKPATVTSNLARLCTSRTLPAYLVLYKLADALNPADETCHDIISFRVKRLWPKPDTEWVTYTPQEWAERLLKLRNWSAGRIDDQP